MLIDAVRVWQEEWRHGYVTLGDDAVRVRVPAGVDDVACYECARHDDDTGDR